MTRFIFLLFMAVSLILSSCSETEHVEPIATPISSTSIYPETYDLGPDFNTKINNLTGGRLACSQNSNYTVQLRTMGGLNISASQVQPNTQYRIVITYSGTYVCCANVAYCTVLAYGFTGGANDASNGSTTITITTDSVLPPFGIIGVVGPTDCSGSCSSAQSSTSTQKEIP